MVDVMGQTPEEFEQMLKDQIAAAEKKRGFFGSFCK